MNAIDKPLLLCVVALILIGLEAIRECANCADACGPNESVSTQIGGECRCIAYRTATPQKCKP